jgi:hypothetical protein
MMASYRIVMNLKVTVDVDADNRNAALEAANANALELVQHSIATGRWSVIDSALAPVQSGGRLRDQVE